jgi:hypothetical protein
VWHSLAHSPHVLSSDPAVGAPVIDCAAVSAYTDESRQGAVGVGSPSEGLVRSGGIGTEEEDHEGVVF